MAVWTDVKRNPWKAIKKLSIDDCVKTYFSMYRQVYGRAVPMELGTKIMALAEMAKKGYSKQANLRLNPSFREAVEVLEKAGILKGARNGNQGNG